MKFSTQKHGYTKDEVNNYIASLTYNYENQLAGQKERIALLQDENERLKYDLKTFTDKESNISNALLVAVDKAKQIEEGSKKVYELEIQRLRLLFNKYRDLLDGLIQDNPNAYDIANTKQVILEFKMEINKVLNKSYDVPMREVSAYDPMRNLLDKMNRYLAKRGEDTKPTVTYSTIVEETTHEVMHTPSKLKPIADVTIGHEEHFENLVDKFLQVGDGEEKNALAQKIMQSSGFDLREAVNPTEELEDIMKFFDFYEG